MILVYSVYVLGLVNYCHKNKKNKMNNNSFIIPNLKQLLYKCKLLSFQNYKL